MKFGNTIVTAAIIGVILLIIIPLSPFFLDVFLVLNIALSLVILLTSMYTKESLEFSIFPSLLLIVTLYRLALNIASTRLILGNGGEAGQVIKTFGSFVIQGNMVVGFIIFVIIVIIQFIVITKGSERVAEVAARFTLDAMPGKQMAIDADLNSGLITEQQAKIRREKVQREADFFGSMDGASKFVKGDAIVSIITILINSVGGIIIGALGPEQMEFSEILQIYILATIGNGLATQIPALLVSSATGILVTRSASKDSLGSDLSSQLTGQPIALIIAGAALLFLILIPGMPKIPFLVLSIVLIVFGNILFRAKESAEIAAGEEGEEIETEGEPAEDGTGALHLLQVDPIELEFGYSIIPLADSSQGGELLSRIVAIRKQCALDIGIIIPVIRLRDNISLNPGEYVIKVRGIEVARGEVMVGSYLAMNPEGEIKDIEGIDTVEPTFGLPARWISEENRSKAELKGYTVVDSVSVLSTHLTEVLKKYSYELLGRQDVYELIENVKTGAPALVEEVIPKVVTLGEVQKVLANLLKEGIPIRDMVTILECLGDYGQITKDRDVLTDYVRQALKRVITQKYVMDNRLYVITLDPELEDYLAKSLQQTQFGSYLSMDPETARRVLTNLTNEAIKVSKNGFEPIVITSPVIRVHFKKFSEQTLPDLTVLSYNEIEQYVEIHGVGMVSL